MHFATSRQLLVMALLWAAALLAFDQRATQRPLASYLADFKGASTRPTVVSDWDTPRVRVSLPHLCCTGCLNDVRAALKPLTWLGPARLAAEPPAIEDVGAESSERPNAHEIEFEVIDLPRADFVILDRALRDTGLAPDRLEVFGMGHFRLEVALPHLCCTLCSRTVGEQLERFLRKESQGRWLDSMALNHVEKTVTIYARFNAAVDILELDRALAQAGFSARTIRVSTGPES